MSPPLTTSITPDAAPRIIQLRGKTLVLDGQPKIVGILNVTPDSFFDGGRHQAIESALSRATQMPAEGAAMIDIGGQSTRPGHVEVSAEEEIARVVPVIEALASRLRVPLSIDTYKPAVARAAIKAGADIINDVHGFHGDPELAEIAAQHGCSVILMHNEASFPESRGATMERIATFLRRSLDLAVAAGVPRERIILDPGIGFAKTHEQNLEILARLGELRSLGCPLLLGASRKSVIGHVLSLCPDERLEGTLATTALAVWQGVEFLRVHDVRANLRAALMAKAIRDVLPASQ
ncbi:MAG: dihydropteroate synthase [Verrucomicrobia bacterium]|nr:dihydropteroate synthase [Verrucomicrobiota bacterium]